jgi:hypothetical protein
MDSRFRGNDGSGGKLDQLAGLHHLTDVKKIALHVSSIRVIGTF